MLELLDLNEPEFTRYLFIFMVVAGSLLALFIVTHIISAIRKWKVQKAILEMRDDIKEIKNYFRNTGANDTPSDINTDGQTR